MSLVRMVDENEDEDDNEEDAENKRSAYQKVDASGVGHGRRKAQMAKEHDRPRSGALLSLSCIPQHACPL